MLNRRLTQTWPRALGYVTLTAGVIGLALAPLVGEMAFSTLWGVEPLTYIGALLVMGGLGVTSLSYIAPQFLGRKAAEKASQEEIAARWGALTQQYFELFHHDLGRPLRRILGKERELRALLQGSEELNPAVIELLDEIEGQSPNFRLMMSNIQVLVQMEGPPQSVQVQPIEPSEVVRKIVDRYTPVTREAGKDLTWWCEPAEFGIVYSDASAIEHIVTNLVDNTVRYATSEIEIKLTKNTRDFFIRVWDDGPGILSQYQRHIFDRGWTPEVARREEKYSSGLGLFIARTLARRYGGELTVESVAAPDPEHYTAFLLSLPLARPETAEQ